MNLGLSAPPIARMARQLLLCLAVLASATHAASAQDAAREPVRVHLQWDRPPSSTCIGYDALTQRVEALLGRKVFVSADDADLTIEGRLRTRRGEWHASLRVEGRDGDEHGVRELQHQGTDCAALNPQLIVVLATLTDDLQAVAPTDAAVRFTGGLTANLESGALPTSSFGGSVLVGARLGRDWGLWLDSSAWLPVTAQHPSGHGGSFWAWQSGLTLCRELRTSRRVAFALCGGGQLGAVDGRGRGLEVNRRSQRLLAQARAEAAIELGLTSSVALRASCGGVLALARPPFFYERADGTTTALYRPAPLGVLFRIGVLVDLR